MGFKIFGKKNGKRTVSDKPENGDTKVTEATKILPDEDPEAVNSYGIPMESRNRKHLLLDSR